MDTKVKHGKPVRKTAPKKKDAIDKTSKQPNLFGPEDKVFNTLENQITLVTAEIRAQYEKIERAQTVITILDERRRDLNESRDIVRERRDDFKAKKKKKSLMAKAREAEKKKLADQKKK